MCAGSFYNRKWFVLFITECNRTGFSVSHHFKACIIIAGSIAEVGGEGEGEGWGMAGT